MSGSIDPVAFACVATATDWLACPHVAVEVRSRHRPHQLVCTIELFGRLRRVEAGGGTVSLHPLPIN